MAHFGTNSAAAGDATTESMMKELGICTLFTPNRFKPFFNSLNQILCMDCRHPECDHKLTEKELTDRLNVKRQEEEEKEKVESDKSKQPKAPNSDEYNHRKVVGICSQYRKNSLGNKGMCLECNHPESAHNLTTCQLKERAEEEKHSDSLRR